MMKLLSVIIWPTILVFGVTLMLMEKPRGEAPGLSMPEEPWWITFPKAFVVALFGILLPLFVFFVSVFLGPESKQDSVHGWLDCWIVGKLALSPVVLYATACLFLCESRLAGRDNRTVLIGLLMGTSVATVSFLYCVFMYCVSKGDGFTFFMLVPAYVAMWHGYRAAQMLRACKTGTSEFLWAVGGSLPFWIGSVMWSRHFYETLPATRSSCFVVTAASRGHENIVGPFFEVQHHGQPRRANQQLITLWAFEALWRARAPRSHALFRRIYNWLGPRIAAQISSPWLADLAWLALKPCEWFASFAINHNTKPGESHESRKVDQLLQPQPPAAA